MIGVVVVVAAAVAVDVDVAFTVVVVVVGGSSVVVVVVVAVVVVVDDVVVAESESVSLYPYLHFCVCNFASKIDTLMKLDMHNMTSLRVENSSNRAVCIEYVVH